MLEKVYFYADKQTGELYESNDAEDIVNVVLNLANINCDESNFLQQEIRLIIKEKYVEEIEAEIDDDEELSEFDIYQAKYFHGFDDGWENYRRD